MLPLQQHSGRSIAFLQYTALVHLSRMARFHNPSCPQVEEEPLVWTAEDFPPEPPKGSPVSLATYQRFKQSYLNTAVENCYLTPDELEHLRAQGCRSWKQYLLRANLGNFE